MDDDQQAPRPDAESGEAIDRLSVPSVGLSIPALVAVFVGGALGTVCRFELDARHSIAPGHFPWVTLLINLSGSFAIGLLVPLVDRVTPRAPLARPFLIVGL